LTEIILQSTVVNHRADLVGVVMSADDEDPIAHVETFLNVLEAWPPDAPAAFVVLGAAPGLSEVIAAAIRWRRIAFSVDRVSGEAALRARTVHVVPFERVARIAGDMLQVAAADPQARSAKVATMLASLADARGAGAVALVLGPGPDPAAAGPIHAVSGTLVHVPRIEVWAAPIVAALREGLRRGARAVDADAVHPPAAEAARSDGGPAPDGRAGPQMLHRLLDHIAEAVIMLDTEGCVRHFTPGATRHFDLLERDIGRPLRHLAHRVWDPTLHADIQEAGLAGVPVIRDLPTGPDRWTSRELRVMRDEDGRNAGYAIFYRDVSDYRRMMKSLARAEMKAREVEGALRLDLLALGQAIGQQLRTLGVLIEMMARKGDEGAMLRAEANEILAALRGRLCALVRVQRNMAGQGARRAEPVVTGELLRALEERVAARADRQGVRLRIVPSSLGALTDRFLLLALLEALLDDLLAGLDGGRVVIGCRRGGGSARIVIAASRPAPASAAVERGAMDTPDDPAGPARSVADAIAESLGVVLRRAAGRRDIALPLVRLPPALMPPAPVSNAPSPVAPPAPSALRADSDSDPGDDPPANRRILGARVLVIMRDGHARAVIAALVRAEGHAVRTARDTAAARALLREEGASVDLLLGESAEGPDALARLAETLMPRADGGAVPHLVLPDAGGAEGADPRQGLAGMLAGVLAARYAAAPDPEAAPRPEDPDPAPGPALALVALRSPMRSRMAAALRAEGARVEVFDTARDLLRAGLAAGCGCVLLDPEGMGPAFEAQLSQLMRAGPELPLAILGGHGDPPLPAWLPVVAVAGFVQRPASAAMILGRLREMIAAATALAPARAGRRVAVGRVAAGFGHDGAEGNAPDPAAGAGGDPPLTDRQRDVLEAVLEGHPSKVIAHRLGISQRTVESHRAAIMRAYGARSLPDLVRRVLAAAPAEARDAPGAQPDLGLFRHGIDRSPDEGAPRPSA
jgi:two-component system CheB/CheR fusion protein